MTLPTSKLEDWLNDDQGVATIKAMAVVEAIRPQLRGLGPLVQSAVLADLVAMWLAGIQGEDKQAARDMMLDAWIALTKNLIAVNEKRILEAHFGKEANQ